MREITIAIAQMSPVLADVGENLSRMSAMLEEICQQDKIDLVVFPELVTTGKECGGVRFTELAERVPGVTVNLLAQRASDFDVHIAFGMVVKQKVESILYNAGFLIGPDGDMLCDYRKVHLRGEEQMIFRPGYRFNVSEAQFGMVGLMVGDDLAFPEVARSLSLDGAELLCICANWESQRMDEWRAYVLSRAYENSTFVVAANRVGDEPTLSFAGESMVVGPRGNLYTSIDDVEGYAIAKIDLDDVRKYREEYQYFQCRQPRSYRNISKMY